MEENKNQMREKLIELWVQTRLERAKNNREIGMLAAKTVATAMLLVLSATVGATYKDGFSLWTVIGIAVFIFLFWMFVIIVDLLLSVESLIFSTTLKIEKLLRGGKDEHLG